MNDQTNASDSMTPARTTGPGESSARGDSPQSPGTPKELPADDPPEGGIWPGSSLDWTSPLVDVLLYVELPFWLLMPAGAFDVKHDEATVNIEIAHECEEGQLTSTHLKNHASTVFIRRPGEAVPQIVTTRIEQSKGWSVRIHRTTLIIRAKVIQSVLDARRRNDLPQRVHAAMYLSALVVGHLPLVNALVTAYRRASYDPFAQDVTEATVPTWFVRHGDEFLRVSVYPYCDHEHRPLAPVEGEVPLDLATTGEVSRFLGTKETPGETILMDAWSYYYAGRFGDSIRALITAVEVLLEARLADLYRAKGKNAEEIDAILATTATKFVTRLNEYVYLSGRAIPGPYLSWVPYINGVRLRQELIDARELRHRIVHSGHRMDPHAHGLMQRVLETVTGLFGWLDGDEAGAARRFRNYALKSGLRGRVLLCAEYSADGVTVLQRSPGESADEVPVADDIHWATYEGALHGPHKDLDLFVKMSLAFIVHDGADIMRVLHQAQRGLIEDRDLQRPSPGVLGERFLLKNDKVVLAVFILDLDGLVSCTDVTGVLLRLLQLRVETKKRVHGLCVVNQQRHLEPSRREVQLTLGDEMEGLLASCDLTLMLAPDLARYVFGARDHAWSLDDLQRGIQVPGYCPCSPPNSAVVAEVVKTFPRRDALGIRVSAPVSEGCRLYVRSERRFETVTVESIEVSGQAVTVVDRGLAGVKLNRGVGDIIEGSLIYRVGDPTPSSPAAAPAKGGEESGPQPPQSA